VAKVAPTNSSRGGGDVDRGQGSSLLPVTDMNPGYALLGLFALAAPPAPEQDPAVGEPISARQSLRHLGEDALYLVRFPERPTRRGTVAAAATLGGTAVLVLLDDEIREHVQSHRSPSRDEWESRLEPLGSVGVTFMGSLSVYAAGRLAKKPEVAETGRALLESLLFAEAFTKVGKGLLGREYPGGDGGAGDFFTRFPGVFPSGHTARAFAVSTVLAERYGPRAAWIGYPLATLVGLARIESDDHWASDVLAGAALGWGVGRAVVRLREDRRAKRLTVVPLVSISERRTLALVSLRY